MASNSWISSPQLPLDLNGPGGTEQAFTPLPPDWIDRPIVNIFADTAARFPDRGAIDDAGHLLSYRQVRMQVAALSNRMLDRTAPGSMIAVALAHDGHFAVAVLSCLAARRPFIAIDLGYPRARIADILRDARVSAVIARAGIDLDGLGLSAGLPLLEVAAACAETELAATPGSNDEPAVVLATSGSTGRPKCVVNSTAAVLQRVLQYVNAGHLTPDDHFLTLSSPCTIAGLREMLTPLLIGGTLHMADAKRVGLREIRRVIGDAGITVCNAVPAMLRSLVATGAGEAAFGRLRLVRLGGETVFWSDIALFRRALPPRCLIQIGYSSTESTGTQWFVPPSMQPVGATVPIGYLLPGNEAMLLAEDGGPAPAGQAGALWIRSRFVCLGEWEGGRLVSGSVRPDPADPGRRIAPTGDLVRMRRNALAEFRGRIDRQIKINGQRAEPAEVEAALRWSKHVTDAAVITVRSGHSMSFVAFVVPAPAAPTNLSTALQRSLRSKLPAFLRPVRIHVLPAIPRLPGAKPDLAALKQLDASDDSGRAHRMAVPSDQIGWAVDNAWHAALGRPACGDNTFEEAGGDSLRFMQFVFQLESLLGRHLALDLFRTDMRPDQLAAAIAHPVENVAVADGDNRPCIVLLPGVNGDEPRLAWFRAALQSQLRFLVVDYPNWPEMVARGRDFPSFVAAVAEWLAQRQPSGGRLLLAGYSFGGAVAAALAQQLATQGRPVTFLGILDTDAIAQPDANQINWLRLVLRWTRHLSHGLVHGDMRAGIAEFLAQHAAHPAAERPLRWFAMRQVGKRRGRASVQFSFALHGWMRILLRGAALRQWQTGLAAQCGSQAILTEPVLFRSEAHAPAAPMDLGWGHATSGLRVVPVPGGHHSMLDMPNRDVLCARFLDEVRRSLTLGDAAHDDVRPDAQPKEVFKALVQFGSASKHVPDATCRLQAPSTAFQTTGAALP